MRAGLLLVLLCGCRQLLGFETANEPPVGDDAGVDGAGDSCAGAPRGLLQTVCFAGSFSAVVLEEALLDTDAGPCTEVPALPGLCFVTGDSITVAGTVAVRGSRPLVLWSASTIEVSSGAMLDVSSYTINIHGAGSDDGACAPVDGSADLGLPRIGSGGCGGSFGSAGGAGGAGSDGDTRIVSSICPLASQLLDRVRGGCPGGNGGLSNSVGSFNGGFSGGAVYLMAADKITVRGVIAANGSGGRTANANSSTLAGGGGGGSGGLIGLDAPTISVSGATLVAIGGGGSSGTGEDASNLFQGNGGHDPTVTPPTFAQGSNATVTDNFGAAGAPGTDGGSATASVIGGGGGAAGGAGYIRAFTSDDIDVTDSAIVPPLSE